MVMAIWRLHRTQLRVTRQPCPKRTSLRESCMFNRALYRINPLRITSTSVPSLLAWNLPIVTSQASLLALPMSKAALS